MEHLPVDLVKVIVGLIGEERRIKQWTTISFVNQHWRSVFLSLLVEENIPYLKTLFPAKLIAPLCENKLSLHEFLLKNEFIGYEVIRVSSFHQIYSQIFGIQEWLRGLSSVKTHTRLYYYNKFTPNDYAMSMYTEEDHGKIMKKFPLYSVEKKAEFITLFFKYVQITSSLEGAVAHPVTGSSHIGYTYSYKKPKREERDLFIMPKKGKKKIYLNGLDSVLDSKRIKKGTKLFHIKSKQHDWSKRQLGEGGGYTRGMDLINLLKPHLLKCQPILQQLMSWTTR